VNKYALALSTLILPASLLAQQSQFVPAPPTTPSRGVIAPLVQLPPNASVDMLVAELREALQGGIVPDISLFQQLASVYDARHYDFYPEVVRLSANVYRDIVLRYLSVLNESRLPSSQLRSMEELAINTHRQALAMADSARIAADRRNSTERAQFGSIIKLLRDQVAQYKGNPATLTMPFLVIPRIAPGDVASRQHGNTSLSDLELMATTQLKAAGDRLGSGSSRSNQWLQLMREYQQAIFTRDAVQRSFTGPSGYSLDSAGR
jgi:hypothetical protein